MYGGTFNPPHMGHLAAAESCIRRLKLDTLLLMPAGQPPHKEIAAGSPTARQRLEMVELAATLVPGAQACGLELERAGKLTSVITQNIDGLHQVAGSKNVIELHGSVLQNYCVNCGKAHSLSYVMQADGVPYCESCGGLVRPDVVLYGEGLDEASFLRAEREIARADVMIVGGTSLTVHPAASLVGLYEGEHLVIINKSMTPYDRYADYVINDSLSDVLKQLIH